MLKCQAKSPGITCWVTGYHQEEIRGTQLTAASLQTTQQQPSGLLVRLSQDQRSSTQISRPAHLDPSKIVNPYSVSQINGFSFYAIECLGGLLLSKSWLIHFLSCQPHTTIFLTVKSLCMLFSFLEYFFQFLTLSSHLSCLFSKSLFLCPRPEWGTLALGFRSSLGLLSLCCCCPAFYWPIYLSSLIFYRQSELPRGSGTHSWISLLWSQYLACLWDVIGMES